MNKYIHRFDWSGNCIKCKESVANLIWKTAQNNIKEYTIWFNDISENSIDMKDFVNLHNKCSISEDEWAIKLLLE